MAKLWAGRFDGKDSNSLLDIFNASLPFDKHLFKEDIRGSIEHARMLESIGLLSSEELELLIAELESIKGSIERGEFDFDIKYEDIHMAIESKLSDKLGDIGKRLHTARSRNDQVALDFKLYCRDKNLALQRHLCNLINTLLDIASDHTKTLMPGMTHLQHAQPISFAYHLIAWCVPLYRDIQRLIDIYKLSNDCPLGSAAMAGTPYHNERESLAKRLGFSSASLNAMDSVSNRDFALDILYACSSIMMHLSRISEELIIWSSYEFGFVRFSDEFSTGSSIMPQKKNPDVVELIRGKCGRTYGNLMSLLTTMKALPLAYNKDMQEDKEVVFDSINTALISLEILNESLKTLEICSDNMLKMCQRGHLAATDLADFLVMKCNVPFREAHFITGLCVRYAESLHVDLSLLDPHKLEQFLRQELADKSYATLENLDSKALANTLDLYACMQRRDSLGGTSSNQVDSQITTLRELIHSVVAQLP